ncbi:MAG: serine hydrolase domain-containing protein, partial [Pseudomonadota bacterium]
MISPQPFKSLLASLLVALTCSCSVGPDTRPVQGNDKDSPLPTASFESMTLDPAMWASAMQDLDAQGMQVDQIALMVDGRLLAARHNGQHSETTLHDIRSATKSVTGLLLGIAIDRGLISSADQPVDSFFPELAPHPSRAAWRALTLRDLLTMRSGLDCDDWRNSEGNEERMYRTSDWVRFFYTIPAVAAPGSVFSYCTAGAVVLGEVIARAARQPLPEFAQTALFEPLGIHNAIWAGAGSGITDAGGHLKLSLTSLLKLGELMRTGGNWQGQRVLSQGWVSQSLRSSGAMWPDNPGFKAHMGQLWWLEPVRDGAGQSYQARGNGGQLIIVVPEFKLVMAVTGHAWNAPPQVQWAPFGLLERW